jgi:hypothetical protein
MPGPFDALAAALTEVQALVDDLTSRVDALESREDTAGNIVKVQNSVTLDFSDEQEVVAHAPAGYVVIAGGHSYGGDSPNVAVIQSHPIPASGGLTEGWSVRFKNDNVNQREAVAYAVCAKATEVV